MSNAGYKAAVTLRSVTAACTSVCIHRTISSCCQLFKRLFFSSSKVAPPLSIALVVGPTTTARREQPPEGRGLPILGPFGVCCRHGAHAENFSPAPKPQSGEYFPSANATKKRPVLGPRRERQQRPPRGPGRAVRPGKPPLSGLLSRPPPSSTGEYFPSANASKKRPVLGGST